jgi:hypothetical protein
MWQGENIIPIDTQLYTGHTGTVLRYTGTIRVPHHFQSVIRQISHPYTNCNDHWCACVTRDVWLLLSIAIYIAITITHRCSSLHVNPGCKRDLNGMRCITYTYTIEHTNNIIMHTYHTLLEIRVVDVKVIQFESVVTWPWWQYSGIDQLWMPIESPNVLCLGWFLYISPSVTEYALVWYFELPSSCRSMCHIQHHT